MKLKNILTGALLFFVGCSSTPSITPLEDKILMLNNIPYKQSANVITDQGPKKDELVFGVVSDLHAEPIKAQKLAEKLNSFNVDGFLIAGDEVKKYGGSSLPNDVAMELTLLPFLKTQKPVYLIAGNHESKSVYSKTVSKLSKSYSNLVDLTKIDYVDLKGVNFFGISGGPFGGFSVNTERKKVNKEVFSLDDDPVLMLSHVPAKFSHTGAVDSTYDVVDNDSGKKTTNRHKGEDLIYSGANVKRINSRNKGDKSLTSFIHENDIDLGISGHYHTNWGANDFEKNLPEGVYHEKLFLNPGAGKFDRAAILTIKDNTAKYELVKIKN
ncbi:hypothetical protein GOV14_02255 [Candidatus Pacearchaeota archaeon]|nr:hypothetical protein [Candidatus Pacearchaeota archaeon]